MVDFGDFDFKSFQSNELIQMQANQPVSHWADKIYSQLDQFPEITDRSRLPAGFVLVPRARHFEINHHRVKLMIWNTRPVAIFMTETAGFWPQEM